MLYLVDGLTASSMAAAQQSIQDGNCNVQLGAGAKNNTVTIICFSGGRSGGSAEPTLVIEATVERLSAGQHAFDVVLHNRSRHQRAEINPSWLSLSDDQGNAYELDCLAMPCASRKIVPPGRMIRFPVTLRQTVNTEAETMFFTLSDIWYAARGAVHRNPLGAVEWAVPISRGPVDTSALEAAERATGITTTDRKDIQFILTRTGFAAGPETGVFTDQTRDAIRQWQQAKGHAATGYLTSGQAMDLTVDAQFERQRERMKQMHREWEERQRQFYQDWRRTDEDFRRRMNAPPPPPPWR